MPPATPARMHKTRAQVKKLNQDNISTNAATDSGKTSRITTLLSQWQLLRSLCEHLSSADIIHLGETSKEHWQYIGSSLKLLKQLIRSSSCDGRGIVAQARVFGHWKGKLENATRKCRGKNAQPCVDCGAMVCNLCRFHLQYPSSGRRSEVWIPESWGTGTDEYFDEYWDDQEFDFNQACEDDHAKLKNCRDVETMKAWSILVESCEEAFCEDCQPLIVDPDDCMCFLYSRFVARWLCIPCVLAEEARLILTRQRCTLTYKVSPGTGLTLTDMEIFCRCGKPIADWGALNCRLCGGNNSVKGSFEGHREGVLRRIYSQFGSSMNGRSDDPILSQLG